MPERAAGILHEDRSAAVSFAPRAPRSKSFTPSSRSKSAIWREIACWARRSLRAARVKLPSSATAIQYRRCRSSKAQPSGVGDGTKLCWIFMHVQYQYVLCSNLNCHFPKFEEAGTSCLGVSDSSCFSSCVVRCELLSSSANAARVAAMCSSAQYRPRPIAPFALRRTTCSHP